MTTSPTSPAPPANPIITMAATAPEPIDYLLSSGSSFSSFDKLAGHKNYLAWKDNMTTMLMSLNQWGMVSGEIVRPPVTTGTDGTETPTPEEKKKLTAYNLRAIRVFAEISYRVSDTAKTVIASTRDPKRAWELLQKNYGAKQEGLQSVLLTKLQMATWDGKGGIGKHRDFMLSLRTQLLDAGMELTDKIFFDHFTNSLPASLDIFVTFYDDKSHDIDLLCDRFSRYEMRQQLAAAKAGDTSEGSVALFGKQQESGGKAKKSGEGSKGGEGLKSAKTSKSVVCWGCGEQGHVRSKCPKKGETSLKSDKDEKKEGEPKEKDKSAKVKTTGGKLYALVDDAEAKDTYYIDSGASNHLTPHRAHLHDYRPFATPRELTAANNGALVALGSGTLKILSSVNGEERESEIRDVYYAPSVAAQLISFGKLEDQGWDVQFRKDGMLVHNSHGILFADVDKKGGVYPMQVDAILADDGFVAWARMAAADPTHDKLSVPTMGSTRVLAKSAGSR